mmetsp:Transcript_17536/g.32892  ORF Transcript_17536/g.32892 Transcript_17536/m.32892 type:complete len:313 (+) Transcript_17536:135-1073(+)
MKAEQVVGVHPSSPRGPHWTTGGGDDEMSTISCTTIPVKDVSVDEECWNFALPPPLHHHRSHHHHQQQHHHHHHHGKHRKSVHFNLPENQVSIVERIPEAFHADVWYSKQQMAHFRYQTQQQALKIAQTAHQYGSFGDSMHRLFHALRCNQNANEGFLNTMMAMLVMPSSTNYRGINITQRDNDNHRKDHEQEEEEQDHETHGLETLAVPAIQSDYQIRRRYLMGQIHRIQQQSKRSKQKQTTMQQHHHHRSSSFYNNKETCCLGTIRDTSRMASRASTLFAQFLAQRGQPPYQQPQQQQHGGVLRQDHVLV